MFVVGLMAPIANGPIQAILQATIAADYQGRAFTLIGSLAGVTVPLGLLLAAPIAEMVGVRAWYLAGGLACISMGIAGFFLPSLMRIEEPPAGAPEEAAPSVSTDAQIGHR
jgi:DHA3 family macrolide efflux protein-like MFS transporter